MTNNTADYDAVVVGAGLSGIQSLWELGKLGLKAKCFEAGSDVGGAWYWNCYPGARTDSEAWVYTMNFAPEVREEWNYSERYPSQKEVQQFLGRIVNKFNLRQHIEFKTRINSAQYSDKKQLWSITTANGNSVTCRYFLPATGPLSIAKVPPFLGLKTYTGEWYQASTWPQNDVDLRGKRVAVIGTGATGVQIIPKIAPAVKQLTVFQRSPAYVLPGRNYIIDENQAADIKEKYDSTLHAASIHPNGLAMKASGKKVKDTADSEKIRQIFDAGWETGGFYYQFETFDANIQVKWVAKTIDYMEKNKLTEINATTEAVDAWLSHLEEAFKSTVFAESSKTSRSWFVGANIPGKTQGVLFYFGGVPAWSARLEKETATGWESMEFSPAVTNETGHVQVSS